MLWKKIDHTINMFRSMSPDMATAQLLCRKPSLSGLVYPRFDMVNNTISLDDAWLRLTGTVSKGIQLDNIVEFIKNKGIKIYAGVDWGFSKYTSIVIGCVLGNSDFFILDSYAVSGLEFDEILKMAIEIRDKFKPVLWICDTAEPMFIKSFKRRGMPCKDFKKDVLGGIEALRTQIVDASGRRRLKVLRHERNEFLLKGFTYHHFKLDAQGNPTHEPDDELYSDVMDASRYLAQVLFGTKGRVVVSNAPLDMQENANFMLAYKNNVYTDWMTQKVRSLASDEASATGKSASGGLIYSFGGDEGDE
jgi:phage terminase large subunit